MGLQLNTESVIVITYGFSLLGMVSFVMANARAESRKREELRRQIGENDEDVQKTYVRQLIMLRYLQLPHHFTKSSRFFPIKSIIGRNRSVMGG